MLYVDRTWGQLCRSFEQQKLTASDGGWANKFGLAGSAFGDRLVVGAPEHDWSTANDGAVYVFRLNDNGTPDDLSDDDWVQEVELNAWDGGGGNMGESVAAYGDRIIAGSIASHDACGGDQFCYSGAVYVFRYTGSTWTSEQKLLASDMAPEQFFGTSVSIHARWIAVGLIPTVLTTPVTGAAYLFRLDDGGTPADPHDDTWVEHAKVTTPGSSTRDRFGLSVAVTDDYLAVGAPGIPYGYEESGSVHVYARGDNGTPDDTSDDVWTYDTCLTAADAHLGQRFGYALAAEGERILVGAFADYEFGKRAGSAYVFARDDHETPSDPSDDTWYEQAKLTASDAEAGDRFGGYVAIHGDRVAIGAPEDYTIVSNNSGSAYVFRYVSGQWIQERKLLATDNEWGETFGRSVALSAEYVFAGNPDDDEVA